MKVIKVRVSPKGETTIQTFGFEGAECQQAAQALEKALGVKTSEQKTAEYYATSTQTQQSEVQS